MENINQNGAFDGPVSELGSIIQLNSDGNSNYNSLQTTLKIRTWHGLTSQFAFTWAHALDEVTEYRGAIPLDSFNLAQEYGNSDFDTRHNFTAFLDLRYSGRRTAGSCSPTDGRSSGLISLHSGQPFNFRELILRERSARV